MTLQLVQNVCHSGTRLLQRFNVLLDTETKHGTIKKDTGADSVKMRQGRLVRGGGEVMFVMIQYVRRECVMHHIYFVLEVGCKDFCLIITRYASWSRRRLECRHLIRVLDKERCSDQCDAAWDGKDRYDTSCSVVILHNRTRRTFRAGTADPACSNLLAPEATSLLTDVGFVSK